VDELVDVLLAGEIRQGKPIPPVDHPAVRLPAAIAEGQEFVYLAGDSSLRAIGIEKGDYLVAEMREDAASGELVVMCVEDNAFVGRFWKKHGRRDVTGEDGQTVIASNGKIIAAINLIVRGIS
jgi:SOS-response transcriptional repressor LexA